MKKAKYDLAEEMQVILNHQKDDSLLKLASAIDNLDKAASILEIMQENESSEIITRVIESLSNSLD